MSEYPTPSHATPPPYAGPPRRQRPRVLWFLVGGLLVALAPIIFVGALFTILSPLATEDAMFEVSDGPVRVDLPAGQERALFSSNGYSADCSAVDGSGSEVEMRPISGEFTFNEWTAIARFDTSDGDLTFECTETSGGGDSIRIGRIPSTGTFVAGMALGVIAPLVLGGTGVIMLIVTAILWASGAPRQQQPPRQA